VLISGTDVDNEVRCAAAVRAALGTGYGSPAQIALRFALANHDVATRVIGVGDLRDLDEAVEAVIAGPLPVEAVKKLEGLWATDFNLP
jgi:aryl-alcohol dehydrogenase-like predicted oxidoreductase